MNVRPTRVAPAPTNQTAAFSEAPKQLPAAAANSMGVTEMRNTAPAVAAYPPVLAKAILNITANINPVQKAGWNDFHKYAYRRFEDVFEELVPLLVQHGVLIEQTEIARGGLESDLIFITYAFTIIHVDGHVWPNRPELTAICKIRDAKGIIDDKAASKCNTQAQKYFYTNFFKIRTADVSEADHDAGPRPSRGPAKRAPAPDGKMAPQLIPIVQGEAPESWAKRFNEKIDKAASEEEINQWYDANKPVFDRLQSKAEYAEVYNGLVDKMDARAAELAGKPNGNGKAAPPPPAEEQAFDASVWLESLENAFSACEDAMSIAEQQERLMIPHKEDVAPVIWKQALAKVDAHLKRVAA